MPYIYFEDLTEKAQKYFKKHGINKTKISNGDPIAETFDDVIYSATQEKELTKPF